MAKVKGFIDADGHVVESDAELLDFLPRPYHGRADLLAFPFFPTLDGFTAKRGALPMAKAVTSPRAV